MRIKTKQNHAASIIKGGKEQQNAVYQVQKPKKGDSFYSRLKDLIISIRFEPLLPPDPNPFPPPNAACVIALDDVNMVFIRTI
jgi:hypothetical protein